MRPAVGLDEELALGLEVPLGTVYRERERQAVVRNGAIVLIYSPDELLPGERVRPIQCRMRSLGCIPCTGAIRSCIERA